MARVLVIAEHDGSTLNPSVSKCVSCAAAIDGAEIDIAVLAASVADIAAQAAALALVQHSQLDARGIVEKAMHIAAALCIYTNDSLTVEELPL